LAVCVILSFWAIRAARAEQGNPPQLIGTAQVQAAVDRIEPALVRIETFGSAHQSIGEVSGGPVDASTPSARPGEGPTTGLIIRPNGLILTSSFNFITRPATITVVLHDGSRHVARLLGEDRTRKLCLLKIDTNEAPVAPIADASLLQPGQWVASVGMGFTAEQPTVSLGIISATERFSGRAVQTDAKTSPVNYGGPLIDLHGRVIGICVPLSPRGRDVVSGVEWYDSGIGFAIPLDGLGSIIERLACGEVIEAGWMGIAAVPRPAPGGGVVIDELSADSPAEAAGLRAGDVLTHLGGRTLFDMLDLRRELGRYEAGQSVTVQFRRAGRAAGARVTLKTAPQS
jgi:serine protease Do